MKKKKKKTEKKCNPAEAAEEIKKIRVPGGEKTFNVVHWLNKAQITSLFSSLAYKSSRDQFVKLEAAPGAIKQEGVNNNIQF